MELSDVTPLENKVAAALADIREDNTRYRQALERIAALDLPYRDTANLARHIARDALGDGMRDA